MPEDQVEFVDGPGQVDVALFVLRAVGGVTLSLHGCQKLFGWFGGGGFEGTAAWFASLGFGDGRAATVMAGGTEVGAGLGLAAGMLTPLAAAGVMGVMTVAALVNHHANGFWSAAKGWETNLYVMLPAVTVALAGPGALSFDAALGLAIWWSWPVGVAALTAGAGLGWLRWTTRRHPGAPDPEE